MKTTIIAYLTCITFAGAVFGASPVATISSSGPFVLRGATVNTEGVPSWPVMAGDEIKTSNAAALIRFKDGSRITLAAGSSARLEQTNQAPLFRLLNGDLKVEPATSTNLAVYNLDKPVNIQSGGVHTISAGSKQAQAVKRPPPVKPPKTASGR